MISGEVETRIRIEQINYTIRWLKAAIDTNMYRTAKTLPMDTIIIITKHLNGVACGS